MRYIPYVGSLAKFEFIPEFSELNGIYRVLRVLSYAEAISDKIDFKTDLYLKAGLEEEEYSENFQNYINNEVLLLQDVSDTVNKTIIPVFESLFTMYPDATIKKYGTCVALATIGLFQSVDEVSWLADDLTDVIRAVNPDATNVTIMMSETQGVQWLTDSEYLAYSNTRKTKIQNLTNIPKIIQINQLKEEIQRLRVENEILRKKIITSAS